MSLVIKNANILSMVKGEPGFQGDIYVKDSTIQ